MRTAIARNPSKPAILSFMWLSSSAKAARKALPFRARVEGPERTGDGKVNDGKGKTSQ
ncbi:hypothetical protein [Paraburkholderia sediminicola]|uniref:hypothetical protein n=1 Tax=Paraburkholderia sediminicola TaxID=458836 RepID=UPI0015840C52|nr:hypothetical protein [Paraburkholderia sediminicola]